MPQGLIRQYAAGSCEGRNRDARIVRTKCPHGGSCPFDQNIANRGLKGCSHIPEIGFIGLFACGVQLVVFPRHRRLEARKRKRTTCPSRKRSWEIEPILFSQPRRAFYTGTAGKAESQEPGNLVIGFPRSIVEGRTVHSVAKRRLHRRKQAVPPGSKKQKVRK